MKRVNKLPIVLFLLVSVFTFSCKNKTAKPIGSLNQKCPLLSVSSLKENIRDYEYVDGNLIRIYSKDSIPTTMVFRYNDKSQVIKMEVATQGSSDKLTVSYTYDDKGNVLKTKTSITGIDIITNDFLYFDNKLSSINTTFTAFGKKITGKTRIEYTGKNVSKVYSAIGTSPETISFQGVKYDDKVQFAPDTYRIAAFGFVGISNNLFAYLGENNLIEGKIFDEKGKVDENTAIKYKYNTSGLPTDAEITLEKSGKKLVKSMSYQFACK